MKTYQIFITNDDLFRKTIAFNSEKQINLINLHHVYECQFLISNIESNRLANLLHFK